MKRIFILFLSFFAFPVFAVTSESYVDSAVAPLQDEIPAVNTNTVLINTGTAGEIGQKQIYDSNADYASQQNALVTVETFNAAVQNAKYVRIGLVQTDINKQVEAGSVATPYVPYGNVYMPITE